MRVLQGFTNVLRWGFRRRWLLCCLLLTRT